MRIAILIAIGLALWLGGIAVKGSLVSKDVGNGIGFLGLVMLCICMVFIARHWWPKQPKE